VNAERELVVALRLSDHDPDTYLYLAKVYAGRGVTALARTHLRRFLELVPGDPEGLELLTTITSGDGA
jgi:Flp pilus assembly protein TadD